MNYEQTFNAYVQTERGERRYLQKRAWFVGISMVLSLPLQFLIARLFGRYLLAAEAVMTRSVPDRLAYYAMYGGYYCAMLLLPVVLCALLFRVVPRLPQAERRGMNAFAGVLTALFGTGFCLLANYITNYWLVFASQFGVQPHQGDYHSEAGWLPLVLNLVTYALLPALVEELVFRGFYISALQPSGERCALVTSALLFGLAHGNLTQMPFAFMLGLLFGWLFLRTGRLWPCMVIHFLNNSLSVVFDSLGIYLPENTYRVMQMAVYAAIVLAGALAGVLLAVCPSFRGLTRPLCEHRRVLTVRRRRRLVWCNPSIIVAVLAYGGLMLLEELVK